MRKRAWRFVFWNIESHDILDWFQHSTRLFSWVAKDNLSSDFRDFLELSPLKWQWLWRILLAEREFQCPPTIFLVSVMKIMSIPSYFSSPGFEFSREYFWGMFGCIQRLVERGHSLLNYKLPSWIIKRFQRNILLKERAASATHVNEFSHEKSQHVKVEYSGMLT